MRPTRAWLAAIVQSRGKGLSETHTAIKARKAFDFIGRFSALLALLFICYGFIVEGHRSDKTNKVAGQARETAAQAKRLSEENRQLALTAKMLAARVDALNKESREILLDSQRGRRQATIDGCVRDRAEHKAIASIFKTFKLGIPVPKALGPVDCKQRLAQANLD
jgi:preprotein translocase subunit SecG